jgi:hypothetical protein
LRVQPELPLHSGRLCFTLKYQARLERLVWYKNSS